jgi:hypothetical protein
MDALDKLNPSSLGFGWPILICLLFSLAFPSVARGQAPDLGAVSIEDLMKIEITSASRKHQRAADVAAAVFVITRDDIRRLGMTTLPDLLRLVRSGWSGIASIALGVTLIAAPAFTSLASAQTLTASDVSVKAAFLYNFAKFAEWSALPSGAPLVVCIVGDDAIAAALVDTVRGQNINGHRLDVLRSPDGATWGGCNLLFVAAVEAQRSIGALSVIRKQPVLTVSDGKGFAQAGGIIEFYVDGGLMRFEINVDSAERSGLRLSSRLLGLAKVIRDRRVQ